GLSLLAYMSALGSPLPASGSYFESPLPELSATWRTPARPCRAVRQAAHSASGAHHSTPTACTLPKTVTMQHRRPPLRQSPTVTVQGSDENRNSSNLLPSTLFPPRPPAHRRRSLVPLFAASNVAPQLRIRTSIASSIEMSPPSKPLARRLSVFCCTPNPTTPLPSTTAAADQAEVDSVTSGIAAQLDNLRLHAGTEPRSPLPRKNMVAWLKRVIRDGGESPEHAEDAETTCPAPSMTEWSSSRTSRTARSATGYDATAGLLDVPLSAMLLVASCLDRESINTLVSVDPRLRDCLIPELPLAAPRRSVRVDKPSEGCEVKRSCGLPAMPKAVVREHLIANVVKPSVSRCLTSPKAASSLPQELQDAGFKLAEEERPQLGEGSFARVSLVVRKDKYYALKTVTKVPLEIRDMAQHMKREVSLHSRLCSHPSIVTLHDSFEDTRRIYMLLEWCPFGSLSETLATLADSGVKAALPLSITACAAAIVVDQLAAAAGYLHDNGVIHRDIKPDNILIASLTPRDVELRLTDFGWSCLAKDAAEIYSKCGTPGFAAPEVFAGRQQTTASDIWSIGAVLSQ
ncbi:hypothetical protein FOZ63_025693, partial [Perkinsus olseni]